MSQANKEVIRKFMIALGSGDVETVKSLITDDIEAVCVGTSMVSGTRGYADIVGVGDLFKKITKAGIRFDILTMTAEEDRVSAEMQGHSDLVTGVPYNNQYHFLFFLRDGRIYRMKEYIDTKLADAALGPLFTAAGV